MTSNHACWEEKLQTTTGLKQRELKEEAGGSIVGGAGAGGEHAVAGAAVAVAVAAARRASAVLEVVLRTSWL